MKILIIGHSLEDHIITGETEEIKPGGIFYSVLGMKSIISVNDEINLCTAVDKNNIELFNPVYDELDKRYFQHDPGLPKVYLNLSGDKEREECYSKISKNLSVEIENPDKYDGFLINMITGYDITREQLAELRAQYNGLIYFDVHTLSRGLKEDGKREFRIIPGFEGWAKNIDILQVNEMEFLCLFDAINENEIIQRLFAAGIKILIVTKAEKGARIFYKLKEETVNELRSALKIVTRNKVGCGDVFGAVFFYSYISNKNPGEALKIANTAAGLAASYDKPENFINLRKDVYTRNS